MVKNDPRHNVSANQSATHVNTWIGEPTEQGTNTPEAIPRANDMWAKRIAHQDKHGTGWLVVDGPVGPTASSLPRGSI